MNNQSILASIHQAVCAIQWKTNLQQQKASLICQAMFNQFINDKASFFLYKQFAQNFFTAITGSKKYYNIKDKLIANDILECDNNYFFDALNNGKGMAKGYRFNHKFFVNNNYTSTNQTFTHSTTKPTYNSSTISLYCPTEDSCKINVFGGQFLNQYITTNMNNLSFDEDIDGYIDQLAIIPTTDLTINSAITEEFIYLTLDKKEYRYSISHALQLANKTGKDLIQYNDQYYLNTEKEFIAQKETQRKIAYCQSIFNLKHQLYYCNRNDTNNRLDYNLTGLKKELFEKIKFEGEGLVELDIANAQFAIAAHINQHLDPTFIYHAQNGTLYQYIEKHLILQPGAGKKLMFRIAFDKVKTTEEFNQIRQLFPLYSNWADSYKKDNKNYRMFANLLQKKEAEIMIDGLLIHLASNGYKVFTIHDALRVKKSQAKEIQNEMNNYFKSIGFICHVRIR